MSEHGWYVRKKVTRIFGDDPEWEWAKLTYPDGGVQIGWSGRPASATSFAKQGIADCVAFLAGGEVVAHRDAYDPNDRAQIVRWLRNRSKRIATEAKSAAAWLYESADEIERGQHWEDSR